MNSHPFLFRTFLSCLQLDRIPLTNDYLHLPRELLDCCAQINQRSHMSKNLLSTMQRKSFDAYIDIILSFSRLELQTHHDDVNQQISQLEQSLDSCEEDYKDLRNNLHTIREMIFQAASNNSELHRHTKTIVEHMNILSSPVEELEKTLPMITELNGRIFRLNSLL